MINQLIRNLAKDKWKSISRLNNTLFTVIQAARLPFVRYLYQVERMIIKKPHTLLYISI